MVKNILITGGSGLVGTEVSALLQNNGYKVSYLTRSRGAGSIKSYYWDIETGEIDREAIESCDAIIHLAGENISSKRWSRSQKQKIIKSRVESANLLTRAIAEAKRKPKLLISASAVGYYGAISGDKIFTEEDKPGTDFLASTVELWEESVNRMKDLGLRVVKLRLGVVMSKEGGALQKITLPLKFGFSAPIGTGKQYVPWISLSDLSRLILFSIENEHIRGVYNAVASESISNAGLMKSLAKAANRLYIPIGVPGFILYLFYGEIASTILCGSRVSNKKITLAGFTFKTDSFSEFYNL